MARTKRRLFILGISLAALLIAVVIVLIPGPDRTPLPNPNGYDDLAKAGAMLDNKVSDFRDLDQDNLSELVVSSREALALGRLGLSRQCRIPQWYSFPPNGSSDLMSIKRLAQALAAEGRLAQLEGHNQQAVGSFLDAIGLGEESSRGGLIIHRMVGLACQGIGIQQLQRIMTNLNCEEIHVAVSRLASVNDNAVPWAETARAERRFMWGQFKHYKNPLSLGKDLIDAHGIVAKAEQRNKRICADVRILMAELAVRCYILEQGHAPETLDQLVPKYLPSVPTDPFSGTPLRYRLQGTNSTVYSVGPDKVEFGP